MAETKTGEAISTDKAAIPLSEAVRITTDAIANETERLKQIADGIEQDPILLDGETTTGYAVRVMIDPSRVARIMLNYQYPLYKVLGEDAPQKMWNELAQMVGLEDVYGVDL